MTVFRVYCGDIVSVQLVSVLVLVGVLLYCTQEHVFTKRLLQTVSDCSAWSLLSLLPGHSAVGDLMLFQDKPREVVTVALSDPKPDHNQEYMGSVLLNSYYSTVLVLKVFKMIQLYVEMAQSAYSLCYITY